MPAAAQATTTAPGSASGTAVERVLTPAGLEAWLVNAPSVPLLTVAFSFRGGAAADAAGSEGLSRMVAGLLDEGAGELDSLAFRTELEDLAIRLHFTAERDALAGRLMTLNENRSRAFELLRMALAEPRFDAEPVERIRQQITSDLQRRRTEPNTVSSRVWFAHAFEGHAYGRPALGTIEAIRGITAADLQGYVGKRLARDNLVIGVAGDITAEELAPLLDRAFAHLPAAADLPPLLPATPATGATLVTPMAIPQSVVTFGLPGIARDDADYYAAYVANYIIGGGGFASRLLEEVREKRGLAYSVHSQLVDAELAPLWLGGVATRNDQVAQSIEVIRAELERMARGDIGEIDLANARTYLTGSFPLRFTSNESVARMLVGMQVADLGIDYIERRNALIEAVRLADVARASARLFETEPLFSVVGEPLGLDDATRLSPVVAANGHGGKG